jgi:hypothetical protein
MPWKPALLRQNHPPPISRPFNSRKALDRKTQSKTSQPRKAALRVYTHTMPPMMPQSVAHVPVFAGFVPCRSFSFKGT